MSVALSLVAKPKNQALPEYTAAVIVSQLRDGETYADIARWNGVALSTVHRYAAKAGLLNRKRGRRVAPVADVAAPEAESLNEAMIVVTLIVAAIAIGIALGVAFTS